MIQQLVYISQAVRQFSQDELVGLLRACRDRNARAGVTGVLLYHHQRFFQVLEGPTDAVNTTLERIARDSRHTAMQVIFAESRRDRTFDQWSMGFVSSHNLPADAQIIFTRLLLDPPGRVADEPQRKVLRVLLNTFRHGVLY